jgi:hypothetical protein
VEIRWTHGSADWYQKEDIPMVLRRHVARNVVVETFEDAAGGLGPSC